MSSKYRAKSSSAVGYKTYGSVQNSLKDSVATWVLNHFVKVEAEGLYSYNFDSLPCFNEQGTKFVTYRQLYVNIPNASADELKFYYGEKIEDKWHFVSGASIVIPRSMIKGHDISKPLSYQQLHDITLKEVYSGYLDAFGNINEDWFTRHCENVGMCADCKTSLRATFA